MWPNCICLRCVILKCTFQKKKKKKKIGGKRGLSKSQPNKCTTNSIYEPYLSWLCTWTNGTLGPYPKTNTWLRRSGAIAFSQGYLSACSSCAIFLASGSSISSTSAHKHASLFCLSFSRRNPSQELRFISGTVRTGAQWRRWCRAASVRRKPWQRSPGFRRQRVH